MVADSQTYSIIPLTRKMISGGANFHSRHQLLPGYAIYVIQNKNVNNSGQKNLRLFSYIFMIYARISIYLSIKP